MHNSSYHCMPYDTSYKKCLTVKPLYRWLYKSARFITSSTGALRCDTCPQHRSARPSIPSSSCRIRWRRNVRSHTQQHRCLFLVNRPLFHPSYASSNLIFRTSCSISERFMNSSSLLSIITRTVYVPQIRTVYLLAYSKNISSLTNCARECYATNRILEVFAVDEATKTF